jgi:hypothetical protein
MSRTEDELAQLEDPAETSGGYAARLRDAAEAELDEWTPPEQADDAAWDELTEEERRERMGKAAQTASPVGRDTVDAPADPEAVDWRAFAREFNFHYAGQGCQNRHTNHKKVRLAIGCSEHIATSAPREFLADALAVPSVPLVETPEGKLKFAKEVLADE